MDSFTRVKSCPVCGKPWIVRDIVGVQAWCADCSCESKQWDRARVKKAVDEGRPAPQVAPGVMDDDDKPDPYEDMGYTGKKLF